MKKQFIILLILVFVLGLAPVNFSNATELATRLKGRILLQIEERGEAWYINPKNEKKYYMADGNEAYSIMRNLGVGINNKDLDRVMADKSFAKQHSGKIFLQVEEHGEAYYIDFNGNAHYLKDGGEAYNIMRDLGLGITNSDLNKISIAENLSDIAINNQGDNSKDSPIITEIDKQNLQELIDSTPKINKTIFLSDWYDEEYSVSIDIPLDYYLYYKNKPHDMGENFENITAFITPDDYYINLLLKKIDDFNMTAFKGDMRDRVANSLEGIVQSNYYIEDWHSGYDEYPKYPIETIFEGNGDCEDLSFLMATLLKATSDYDYYGIRSPYYSVALVRFPDHLGVGLSYEDDPALTAEESFDYIYSNYKVAVPGFGAYFEGNNKKYFYIESTNSQFENFVVPKELLGQKYFIHPLAYNIPYID